MNEEGLRFLAGINTRPGQPDTGMYRPRLGPTNEEVMAMLPPPKQYVPRPALTARKREATFGGPLLAQIVLLVALFILAVSL